MKFPLQLFQSSGQKSQWDFPEELQIKRSRAAAKRQGWRLVYLLVSSLGSWDRPCLPWVSPDSHQPCSATLTLDFTQICLPHFSLSALSLQRYHLSSFESDPLKGIFLRLSA